MFLTVTHQETIIKLSPDGIQNVLILILSFFLKGETNYDFESFFSLNPGIYAVKFAFVPPLREEASWRVDQVLASAIYNNAN